MNPSTMKESYEIFYMTDNWGKKQGLISPLTDLLSIEYIGLILPDFVLPNFDKEDDDKLIPSWYAQFNYEFELAKEEFNANPPRGYFKCNLTLPDEIYIIKKIKYAS